MTLINRQFDYRQQFIDNYELFKLWILVPWNSVKLLWKRPKYKERLYKKLNDLKKNNYNYNLNLELYNKYIEFFGIDSIIQNLESIFKENSSW